MKHVKVQEHYITVNNKKYIYTLRPVNKNTTHIECSAAHINQDFLNEDIPALLIDLPYLIIAEKEYQKQHNEVIRFRVSVQDKKYIEQKALKKGYKTVSSFIRDVVLKG